MSRRSRSTGLRSRGCPPTSGRRTRGARTTVPALFESPSAVPTLVAGDQAPITPLGDVARPIFTAAMDRAYRSGKALASLLLAARTDSGLRRDIAVIVDLDGPESVAFAAGAAEAFDPVFRVRQLAASAGRRQGAPDARLGGVLPAALRPVSSRPPRDDVRPRSTAALALFGRRDAVRQPACREAAVRRWRRVRLDDALRMTSCRT